MRTRIKMEVCVPVSLDLDVEVKLNDGVDGTDPDDFEVKIVDAQVSHIQDMSARRVEESMTDLDFEYLDEHAIEAWRKENNGVR